MNYWPESEIKLRIYNGMPLAVRYRADNGMPLAVRYRADNGMPLAVRYRAGQRHACVGQIKVYRLKEVDAR